MATEHSRRNNNGGICESLLSPCLEVKKYNAISSMPFGADPTSRTKGFMIPRQTHLYGVLKNRKDQAPIFRVYPSIRVRGARHRIREALIVGNAQNSESISWPFAPRLLSVFHQCETYSRSLPLEPRDPASSSEQKTPGLRPGY